MKSKKPAPAKIPEKSHSKELRDFKERKDAETKVLEKLLNKINANPSSSDSKEDQYK